MNPREFCELQQIASSTNAGGYADPQLTAAQFQSTRRLTGTFLFEVSSQKCFRECLSFKGGAMALPFGARPLLLAGVEADNCQALSRIVPRTCLNHQSGLTVVTWILRNSPGVPFDFGVYPRLYWFRNRFSTSD